MIRIQTTKAGGFILPRITWVEVLGAEWRQQSKSDVQALREQRDKSCTNNCDSWQASEKHSDMDTMWLVNTEMFRL